MVPALTYPTALPPATAASAGAGLGGGGMAGAARGARGPPQRVPRALAARHPGDAGRRHEPARPDLVAHLLDHLPGGPDEDEPGVRAGLGEAPVLRQEAVAGVDGLDSDAPGGIEDALDVEIALARRGGGAAPGLVGLRAERPRA